MITETRIPTTLPVEKALAEADSKALRHGRAQSQGFALGQYLQPPPMLFTRDGHNMFLGDIYRGRSAFLICSGPSLLTHDLELLTTRGVLTLAVNNAATVVRPHLWCSVDNPMHFHESIWRDPAIWKFVPVCHMEKPFAVRNEQGELERSTERVGDMPALLGFRRNENFQPDQWLYEDSFNWGNQSKRCDCLGQKGSRSIFYIALRLLFYLGVRRVYLLGCDFQMEFGKPNYAFEQDRSRGSVAGNNSSYRILNQRLQLLQPHFEQAGFEVLNCTPQSGLTVFPSVSYDMALREATAMMPRQIITRGMYDQKTISNSRKSEAPGRSTIRAIPVAQQVRPPGIPKTTVVLNLRASELTTLEEKLPQWWDKAPWLQKCFYLIRSCPQGIQAARQSQILRQAPFLQFQRRSCRETAQTFWQDLAQEVKTPWAVLFDLTLTSIAASDIWPRPEWFQCSEEKGTAPVLIGEDSQLSRSPVAGRENRSPFIQDAGCWLDMQWLKQQQDFLSGEGVDLSSDLSPLALLSGWASRTGQSTLSIDLEQFGWKRDETS